MTELRQKLEGMGVQIVRGSDRNDLLLLLETELAKRGQ